MEGPPFAIVLFLFTFSLIWLYQTFFQKAAPDDRAFEAYCDSKPLLAAFAVSPSASPPLVLALKRALGKRSEVVVTLGPWPWPHYALTLDVSASGELVCMEIVGRRLLRTREVHPPALTNVLLPLTDTARSSWLHPACFVDGLETTQNAGWRLAPESLRSRQLEPWLVEPEWLRS